MPQYLVQTPWLELHRPLTRGTPEDRGPLSRCSRARLESDGAPLRPPTAPAGKGSQKVSPGHFRLHALRGRLSLKRWKLPKN